MKGFDLKKCDSCFELLAACSFFRGTNYCRPCSKRRRSEAHGWSVLKYDKVLKEQKDSCAICKVKTEDLVIDHDHASGFRRGLLCGKCNTGLGEFDDNTGFLKAAIDYLIDSKRKEFNEALSQMDKQK